MAKAMKAMYNGRNYPDRTYGTADTVEELMQTASELSDRLDAPVYIMERLGNRGSLPRYVLTDDGGYSHMLATGAARKAREVC